MNKQEIIEKVMQKKEFSQLPKKDVELALSYFEKRQVSEEEKIRLTRELLHKVFGIFTSRKLLSLKNKSPEWILRKHLSTRERMNYYSEIYKKIFKNIKEREISVIDLGAGVNGFSYKYLEEVLQEREEMHSQARDIDKFDNKKTQGSSDIINSEKPRATLERSKSYQKSYQKSQNKVKLHYIAVEAVGQLVNLMNYFFENEKIKGKAFHLSLFDLKEIKNLIKKQKKPRIVFLFKVIDSVEMLKRNYSKKLILEIGNLSDRIVLSFATKSIIKKKKFKVNRNWILNFIKDNFKITNDFLKEGERYLIFSK